MKNKILTGVAALFGLMMMNSGLNKFFNYMPMELPDKAGQIMTGFLETGWLMPLVAFAEIIGGVLFIIPKTRALGAIVIFPIVVGVFLFNFTSMPSALPVAISLLAINLWVIMDNYERYLHLIK